MVPIREQLMALVRSKGGTIKENDSRIPALLKQLKELTEEEDQGPNQ